ncbi:2TM domain-containing protein [Spirosoma areae]
MESTPTTPDRDPYLWKQAKARVAFRMHFRTYLIVNAGLWLIWALSSFAFRSSGNSGFIFPWPIFPMLGWGIGLTSHYYHAFRGNDERSLIEREYQKLANK